MESKSDEIERIDQLDEVKILGYFESIRSVFLIKSALLWGLERTQRDGEFYEQIVAFASLVAKEFVEPLGLKALQRGNWQIRENLKEDILTSSLLAAWAVFEQITREVPNPGYAGDATVLTAGFERNVFGFTRGEKADLQFFRYFRHSIMHYNGAYYAHRAIDHTYNGKRYESSGHHG